MTEALLFASVGSLLTIGTAILTIATLTLRKARKYVELSERRMEYLHEEQTRLLVFLLEERQSLKEELERERRLEAQQEREDRDLRTRRVAERRIDDLKRELLELRKVPRDRGVAQRSSSAILDEMFEDTPRAREPARERPSPIEETKKAGTPRPASPPPPQVERQRLAVWHPHPDDDVSPGTAPARQSVSPSPRGPVEMFRRHYDKYLENYEGYVKLAERIFQMRGNAESARGPLAEREWEERLRRVNDGIKRTTARLDILEEYNPELATDDRISRRAAIARHHSELQRTR